jgi:L-malate glycosyltransferase
MRINFLLPHLKNSGGGRIVLTYAELLFNKGHDVKIISPSSYKNIIKNIFVKEYCWFGDLQSKVILKRKFCANDIPEADVTIADSWKMAKILIEAGNKVGVKVNFVQHDERLFHGEKLDVERVYKYEMGRVVVSSWLEEMFNVEFCQSTLKLVNPVDQEFVDLKRRKRGDGNLNILLLAHPYSWKGTKEGVEIVHQLKRRFPKIKLWLYGSRQKEVNFNCDKYFYKLSKKEIIELYGNTDIFLCPSYFEGFGLGSAEAMACGCALVTYDNGGSRDFAIDGETAYVAENGNQIDLLKKLEECILNSEVREVVVSRGVNKIKSMSNWREQVNNLEKFLHNALSNKL